MKENKKKVILFRIIILIILGVLLFFLIKYYYEIKLSSNFIKDTQFSFLCDKYPYLCEGKNCDNDPSLCPFSCYDNYECIPLSSWDISMQKVCGIVNYTFSSKIIPVGVIDPEKLCSKQINENLCDNSCSSNNLNLRIACNKECESCDFFDMNGKCHTLNYFGQYSLTEIQTGAIKGNRIFHIGGIVIDKNVRPNTVYISDIINSRILAFKSLGICNENPQVQCTSDSDCPAYDSCKYLKDKEADMVFGQEDMNHGACNRNNLMGIYGFPSPETLCFVHYPDITNVGEYGARVKIDLDSKGNLYVFDVMNNRVLKYSKPFGDNFNKGEGDSIADFVFGQPSFYKNEIKLGPSSIYSRKGYEIQSHGIKVDAWDNLWVTDLYNHRVLRFPPNSNVADVVIGQKDFYSSDYFCDGTKDPYVSKIPNEKINTPLNRLCIPTDVEVNSKTGRVYIADQQSKRFKTRILMFDPIVPPTENSAPIYKQTNEMGKELWVNNSEFEPFKHMDFDMNFFLQVQDLEVNYDSRLKGELWIVENAFRRVLLVDDSGNITHFVNSPNITSSAWNYAWRGIQYCYESPNSFYDLLSPSVIAFDSDKNIIIGDDSGANRLAIYDWPYNVSVFYPQDNTPKICKPVPKGGIMGRSNNLFNGMDNTVYDGAVGVTVYKNQLIGMGAYRFMVWNNYRDIESGNQADFILGMINDNGEFDNNLNNWFDGWTHMGVIPLNGKDYLAFFGKEKYFGLYELPLTPESVPAFKGKLVWEDNKNQITSLKSYSVVYDKFNERLWFADERNNRILSAPLENIDFNSKTISIDLILGQNSKDEVLCNRNPNSNGYFAINPLPTRNSFCVPTEITFDNFGNMFVIEGTYEGHGNMRTIMFSKESIQSIIPPKSDGIVSYVILDASKVFDVETFDSHPNLRGKLPLGEKIPNKPISLGFNSQNEMVVGTDGTYLSGWNEKGRADHQLYFYQDPLKKNENGEYVQGQKPDALIPFQIGAVGQLTFDEKDNLIFQDHTFRRIAILNFNKTNGDRTWFSIFKESDIDNDEILDSEDLIVCGNSKIEAPYPIEDDRNEECDEGDRNGYGSCSILCKKEDNDGDGFFGTDDNCPLIKNINQLDSDGDGIGDVCDDCPSTESINKNNVNYQGCVLPKYESFKSGMPYLTTNFSNPNEVPDLKNVKVSLSIPGKSRVIFNEPINAEGVNFDNIVKLEEKRLFVDVDKAPFLNVSSSLRFFNINFITPKLLKNGVECSEEVCKFDKYEKNVYKTNVEGFSEYSLVEGYIQPDNGNGNGGGGGGGGGNRPAIILPVCNVNWSCSFWSDCINGTKTRICNDLNKCNNNSTRPSISEKCVNCVEEWECSEWSSCVNGKQTRICLDKNNCDTFTKKPKIEEECQEPLPIEKGSFKINYYYLKIIGIGILLICLIIGIVVILIQINRRLKKRKSRVKYKIYDIKRKNYIQTQEEIYNKFFEAKQKGDISSQREYYQKYNKNKEDFKKYTEEYFKLK